MFDSETTLQEHRLLILRDSVHQWAQAGIHRRDPMTIDKTNKTNKTNKTKDFQFHKTPRTSPRNSQPQNRQIPRISFSESQ